MKTIYFTALFIEGKTLSWYTELSLFLQKDENNIFFKCFFYGTHYSIIQLVNAKNVMGNNFDEYETIKIS